MLIICILIWKLENILRNKLSHASVSRIQIERPANNAKVIIHTARPGIVIGKKGEDIEKLRFDISKRMGVPATVSVEEIRKPELDAQLVAESVAQQIERRIMFRRCDETSCNQYHEARCSRYENKCCRAFEWS